MTGSALASAVCAGAAVALVLPARSPLPRDEKPAPPSDPRGWMLRWRPLWCSLAAAGTLSLLSGAVSLAAAPAAAVAAWVWIGRAEPPAQRRDREAARRDLPHVVGLLGDALRAGQSPVDGVSAVTAALPGAAADRLSGAVSRLRLGVDPAEVWSTLATDPSLAPVGRTLARAHVTGAPVVVAVQRLADELARESRAAVEDRARAVGVRAAVPLGLCLLPAFVLLGIVPVVAGLLSSLAL